MRPCNAKLPDGNPCPNQADEEQEYCPYHLAKQDAETKKIFSIAGTVLGVLVTGVVAAVIQFLDRSKRE